MIRRAARHWPETLFVFVVLLYLVPIWVFPYLPTQDGPSHLYNALILSNYGSPHAHYLDYYELRWEPFPNWGSHILLAALVSVFPPLIAEKLLASFYVVGLAWSYRYFLGSFGGPTRGLALIGPLFIFNRCFLMGFYAFSLSLICYWFILGYCVRRSCRFGARDAACLAVLLTAAYFTHLVGYCLAAFSAALMLLCVGPGRLRRLPYVALALLPSGCLLAWYLHHTGFVGSPEAGSAPDALRQLLQGTAGLDSLTSDLEGLGRQLFEPYKGWGVTAGPLVLLLYEALVLVLLVSALATRPRTLSLSPRLAVALLGALAAGLYLFLPDSFGEHGSFMKARLALFAPMIWLACFQFPRRPAPRLALQAAIVVVLGLNLVLLVRHFDAANRDLSEFTAAVDQVPRDKTVVAYRPYRPSMLVDYFEHADAYYCLGTGNIDLHNYEAETRYFPVRYRPEVSERWRGGDLLPDLDTRPADVILLWNSTAGLPAEVAASYREVYRSGRLRVFESVARAQTARASPTPGGAPGVGFSGPADARGGLR
jgi:hypothetical protein